MKKILLSLLVSTVALFAKDITVEFDDPDNPAGLVLGYKLHVGTNTTRVYNEVLNLGTNRVVVLRDVVIGKKYFIAASAFDTNNISSDLSEELMFVVPKSPKNIKIRVTLQQTSDVSNRWEDFAEIAALIEPMDSQKFYRASMLATVED